jgi:glycosyltransferase involved in cell wall biosynthesis
VKTATSIVPTGIDPVSFPIKKRSALSEKLRKEYRIPRTSKILIYVGRLAKEKNIDLIIEALAMIVRKDAKVILILVGPGDQKPFQEFARRLTIEQLVIFAGPKSPPEVKEYLVASDILVFSSLTDTQGIVILEAMAAGCVPVACNVGGPTDIIRDRVDGRLTSPISSEFANRIIGLLHNRSLYETLRANALKKANRYSLVNQAEELEAIYDQVIAKKR